MISENIAEGTNSSNSKFGKLWWKLKDIRVKCIKGILRNMQGLQRVSGIHIFPHITIRKLSSRGRYQRFIIYLLATQLSSMTRLALAKMLAKNFKLTRNNGYNHVYVELSTSLIPNGVVEEYGSLPAVRGPRVLQKDGVKCFRLTNLGRLTASVFDEIPFEARKELLSSYLKNETSELHHDAKELIAKNLEAYPEFAFVLIKHAMQEYFDGRVTHPLDVIPRKALVQL